MLNTRRMRPRLFGRNRGNLTSVWDSDHGGPPKQGRGAPWVREVLAANGIDAPARIELLTQPRVLGHVFNPVSFWLCHDATGDLRVVIAEVTNTFGDRHSYLVHRDDFGPIQPEDRMRAAKLMHVAPSSRSKADTSSASISSLTGSASGSTIPAAMAA